ncbi:MAG: hypothetical protein IJK01_10060 [Clostridia bacterium]|nr:hypothetical protein [Clostridia bacterium]
MSKPIALLAYQDVDLEKQQVENGLRTTDARVRLNKLSKLLKTQQATLKKLTDDLEAVTAVEKRINQQYQATAKRLELETSELQILENDEETTAEEMTEFRQDIEKLNKELSTMEKELKQTFASLEQQIAEFQKTRQIGSKAKKEYDQLREICNREKDDAQKELDALDTEMLRKERDVDPKLMARYKRARMHHGTPVVPVKEAKCSGCNVGLPTLALSRLLGDGAVIECENCGRLLYIDQD